MTTITPDSSKVLTSYFTTFLGVLVGSGSLGIVYKRVLGVYYVGKGRLERVNVAGVWYEVKLLWAELHEIGVSVIASCTKGTVAMLIRFRFKSVIAILALCMLFGIFGYIIFNAIGDRDEIEAATQTPEQWVGYKFDNVIIGSEEISHYIGGMSIHESLGQGNTGSSEYILMTRYQGIENLPIVTVKSTDSVQSHHQTLVSDNRTCYKLDHLVTVSDDGLDLFDADWAKMSIWIPVDDVFNSETFFGVCVKAEYSDSQGNTAVWSYNARLRDTGNCDYFPYSEGQFHGFDEYVLEPLYAIPWEFCECFTVGKSQQFHEGEWMGSGPGELSIKYECDSHTMTGATQHVLGSDLKFDFWALKAFFCLENRDMEYRFSFSSDMGFPVQVFLKEADSEYLLSIAPWPAEFSQEEWPY